MTNLKFSTNLPQAYDRALTASSSATGYSANNLLCGPKNTTWKTSAAVASATLTFGAGSAFAVDHFILGGMLSALNEPLYGFDVLVEYSTNGSSWTTYALVEGLLPTTSGVSSASGEDYLYLGTLSATKAYWRLTITPGTSAVIELSKFYLGTAFDMGRDPASIKIRRRSFGQFGYRSAYEIAIDWEDIDYATALSFQTNVVARAAYHPIFMFTTETDTYSAGPLANNVIYYVEITDAQLPARLSGSNNISLVLREST